MDIGQYPIHTAISTFDLLLKLKQASLCAKGWQIRSLIQKTGFLQGSSEMLTNSFKMFFHTLKSVCSKTCRYPVILTISFFFLQINIVTFLALVFFLHEPEMLFLSPLFWVPMK